MDTTTPRCGKDTISGPCARPLNHGHGHASQKVLDNKKKGGTAKVSAPLTPEEITANELMAQAKEAAKAAKAARAAAIEKAETERVMAWLSARDLKAVAMSKAEIKARDDAAKAEVESVTEGAETTGAEEPNDSANARQ